MLQIDWDSSPGFYQTNGFSKSRSEGASVKIERDGSVTLWYERIRADCTKEEVSAPIYFLHTEGVLDAVEICRVLG